MVGPYLWVILLLQPRSNRECPSVGTGLGFIFSALELSRSLIGIMAAYMLKGVVYSFGVVVCCLLVGRIGSLRHFLGLLS